MGHSPSNKIKIDLNTTRMASAYSLTRSSLRVRISLRRHFSTYDATLVFDEEGLEFSKEVEGALNSTKDIVTLLQN